MANPAAAAKANGTDDTLAPEPTHQRNGSLASVQGHSRAGSVSSTGSRVWTHLGDDHLEGRKAAVTAALMASVRGMLPPGDRAEVTDAQLNQYLRATKLDAPKGQPLKRLLLLLPSQAAKRLQESLAWRRKERPDTRLCRCCLHVPNGHYLHIVGYSRRDQPIMYSCFGMAKDRDYLANREHMLVTFEQAVRAMPPHVSQWIWIADFHGFGLRDMDPRMARAFLEVSERHYPERLARFLCVSAPSLFSGLWRLIEPTVDPETRRKIRFATFDARSGKGDKLRAELEALCEPATAAWLLAEMAQNRGKQAAKRKVYPYAKVHAPPGGPEAVLIEGHDCRGTPEWIEAVQQDPSILLPAEAGI